MAANMQTVEYYSCAEPDRLIGAVYVPENISLACAQTIGRAIIAAWGGNELTAHILDKEGNLVNETTVFRRR